MLPQTFMADHDKRQAFDQATHRTQLSQALARLEKSSSWLKSNKKFIFA